MTFGGTTYFQTKIELVINAKQSKQQQNRACHPSLLYLNCDLS